MRTHALALAAVASLAGCGVVDNFLCDYEAIRARLRMPLVAGEDASSDELAGNLESRRDQSVTLDAVENVVEGRALPGQGVAMWLQRGLDHTLNLTLRFPTPLRTGDVVLVTAADTSTPPNWGIIPAPNGLLVGVRLDAYVATSASGSARVLGVDPLRIQLDVVTSDGTRQVPITGTLVVQHQRWTDSCFQ